MKFVEGWVRRGHNLLVVFSRAAIIPSGHHFKTATLGMLINHVLDDIAATFAIRMNGRRRVGRHQGFKVIGSIVLWIEVENITASEHGKF